MNPYVLMIIHSIGIGQNISVLIGHYLGWEFFPFKLLKHAKILNLQIPLFYFFNGFHMVTSSF